MLRHLMRYAKKPRRACLRAKSTAKAIQLETGLRPNSAGIPCTLLLRIEAMGFPTFGLLL